MRCENHVRCADYLPEICDFETYRDKCEDYQAFVRWKLACGIKAKERQDTETRDSIESWATGLNWHQVQRSAE